MMPTLYRRSRICGRRSGIPALFLDRDGVIVEDVHYLHRTEDIHYIEGALSAISSLNETGVAIVLITNQAGVGRGLFGWTEFDDVQSQIERDLAAQGGWLDGVWACGAPPAEGGKPDDPFRKPNPGMLCDAAEKMGLDLTRSWMLGDKPLDIEAGLRAGVRGVCQVATGYGWKTREEAVQVFRACSNPGCELLHRESIVEAARSIAERIRKERGWGD